MDWVLERMKDERSFVICYLKKLTSKDDSYLLFAKLVKQLIR